MRILYAFLLCLFTQFCIAQSAESGIASYYGDHLHGNLTASGEKYDKFKFTAAHKTLPFGTVVKVTRQDDNSSVIVKINDRGPFKEGRIIDLSRAAANRIGLDVAGLTAVRMEVIDPAKTVFTENRPSAEVLDIVSVPVPTEEPAITERGNTSAVVDADRAPAMAAPKKEVVNHDVIPVSYEYDKPLNAEDLRSLLIVNKRTDEMAERSVAASEVPAAVPIPEAIPTEAEIIVPVEKGTKPATSPNVPKDVPAAYDRYIPVSKPATTTTAANTGNYSIQVGAYTSMDNAERARAKWEAQSLNETRVYQPAGQPGIYKVVVGNFGSRLDAQMYREQLQERFELRGFILKMK